MELVVVLEIVSEIRFATGSEMGSSTALLTGSAMVPKVRLATVLVARSETGSATVLASVLEMGSITRLAWYWTYGPKPSHKYSTSQTSNWGACLTRQFLQELSFDTLKIGRILSVGS